MVTGAPVTYVSSGGFIEPPTATDVLYRKAHPEPVKKPTGLDWNALTPTCPSCQTKSGQIDATGLCPTCRGTATTPDRTDVDVTAYATYQTLDEDDVTRRFNAPTETPQAAANADETQVEAMLRIQAGYEAAEAADLAAHRAAELPVVPSPPTVRAKVRRVSPHDVVITICSPTEPIDQVAVAALLSDLLAALGAQSPAAPSPAAAGPTSEGRTRVGKPARPSDTPTAVIRAWGHKHGLLSPEHTSGRLPAAVRDAYEFAHPTTSTTN